MIEMILIFFCVLVYWTKVTSASEGITVTVNHNLILDNCKLLGFISFISFCWEVKFKRLRVGN